MKEIIQKELDTTERSEKVSILLAVESGSRAWGFASEDSDYDVRFLYLRPMKDYLRLDPCRDVIEGPMKGEWNFSGWDEKSASASAAIQSCFI